MRSYIALLIFSLILFKGVLAQDIFKEFKALENRVKYNYPDSLNHFSSAIDANEALNLAVKYWSKGKAEFWQSNYPQAYVQLEKASELIKKLNRKDLLAEIYLDLSSSLTVVDKNGRALSYLLEANDLLETEGTREQKTRAAISLGELYRKIGEKETALVVLRKTLPLTEGLTYNRARCLNRMAAVFSETSKFDSSLYYSYQSLELAETLNDPDLIATCENEIGYVLRQQDKFVASLPHFYKADSLWRSVGMYRYAMNPVHHVAVVLRSIDQFEKGLRITQKAYRLVKGRGWYQLEMNLTDDLKMFHDYLENHDSVLFYDRERLQAIVNWKDEQHEVNTKMVEILFTQKENEQKIREQEVLIENQVLEKAAIKRERTFLWVTLSLIGLILVIIFSYAYKQNRLKIQLSKENEEKESKNRQLTNALEANEALVQEISHRVKNNLAVLSGLLSMQATRSKNEEVIKELNDSVLRIESIATIHKKLYDKRTDAKVDLKEALSELSFNVMAAMGKNPKDCLETKMDPCEIEIAKAVTFCLIINEVITNSCKYGEITSEKKLSIELKKIGEKITCHVSDHGLGFNHVETEKNTDSLGLYLIKLLAKQLNAKITWQKTKENFTFNIQFSLDE